MICLDKRFCLFVSGHTFKYIWVFAFIYLFIASWPRFCVGVIDPNWCRDKGWIWCLCRAFIVVLTKSCRMAGSSVFFGWEFGAVTHRTGLCCPLHTVPSQGAVSLASRGVPADLAVPPVLLVAVLSQIHTPHLHCGSLRARNQSWGLFTAASDF